MTARDPSTWRPRPWASRLLRAAAVVVPSVTGLLISLLLSHVLPRPSGAVETGLWWSFITGATVAVLTATERLTHRLLPIAALLKLSLAFPDRAPRRFALARRGHRVADIERSLESIRQQQAGSGEVLQQILGLVALLSVHDRATRGHSERVRVLTDMIAAEMALSDHDKGRLRWAALLHDVGKLRVPAAILNKPGQPDAEEWDALRRHPDEGRRIIAPIAAFLGPWAATVAQHHERWDGGGYPLGLSREQISLGGRIVAVADGYETITGARPYRKPLSAAEARAELVRCAGTQYDPAVVRAFLNVSVGRVWRAGGIGAWLGQLPLLGRTTWLLGRAGDVLVTGSATMASGAVLVGSGLLAAPPPVAAAAAPAPVAAATPGATATPAAGGGTPSARGTSRATTTATPAPGSSPTPARSAGATSNPNSGGKGSNAGGSPQGGGSGPASPPGHGGPTPSVISVSVGGGTSTEGGAFASSGSCSGAQGNVTGTVDYGDGGGPQPLSVKGCTFSLAHTYGDEGTYAISVQLSDPQGDSGAGTASVRVTDVAPSVSASATSVKKKSFTGTAGVTDPSGDAITLSVDYGDGSTPVTIALGTARSASLAHLYATDGTFTVTVTATDDDGTSATTSLVYVDH